MRPPSCSQRYLKVTTETIDWKDGEDPIFRTIIPVDDEERASLIANSPSKTSVLDAISPGEAPGPRIACSKTVRIVGKRQVNRGNEQD